MTQHEFNQRLTVAIVRLGAALIHDTYLAERAAKWLFDGCLPFEDTDETHEREALALAQFEMRVELLVEKLPDERRCMNAMLLEKVKSEVLK